MKVKDRFMNSYKPEGSLISTPKNREYVSCLKGLEVALEKQIILEAPAILCDRDFNLHISLCPDVYGIIQRDEAEYIKEDECVKDIAILTKVGKAVCFKVKGFGKDESGRKIAYLSRKEAQRDCMLNYVSSLTPGDIIPAKVTHLESFGAFVDIGCGIVSLLSIDCISVSRISHPGARLSVSDNLFVIVKKIDERGRIYVSARELLGSWEENAAKFSEGQTVRGIVRSVEDYGIFVELTPNLAGLAEFKARVEPEQTAAVFIKSIIPSKMKVKLIIIDTFEGDEKSPLKYYFNDNEINLWRYSPDCCQKNIFTDFLNQ
jgi:small subunit ribosomal protein S1